MSNEVSKQRVGLWAAGGSVLSAAVASACCWLPLLLLAFGASAVGVSAFFESVRPYFLTGAALLLGAGFYLNYLRKEKCEPGSECSTVNPKLQRFNRTMLWVATVAVLALALFPNYVGALLGAGGGNGNAGGTMEISQTVIGVEGMTCEGCAVNVEKALMGVPGVAGASVSYSEGRAVIDVDADSPPSHDALFEAITKAGYKPVESSPED